MARWSKKDDLPGTGEQTLTDKEVAIRASLKDPVSVTPSPNAEEGSVTTGNVGRIG